VRLANTFSRVSYTHASAVRRLTRGTRLRPPTGIAGVRRDLTLYSLFEKHNPAGDVDTPEEEPRTKQGENCWKETVKPSYPAGNTNTNKRAPKEHYFILHYLFQVRIPAMAGRGSFLRIGLRVPRAARELSRRRRAIVSGLNREWNH